MRRSFLGPVGMATATKTVYVLCGLPFSGKTTYAQTLLSATGALLIERDAFLEEINSDAQIRERLRGEAALIQQPLSKLAPTREGNQWNDVVTHEYTRRVRATIQASRAETIVVDGTHLWPLSRMFVQLLSDCVCIAIVIDTSPEVCVQRLQASLQEVRGVRATVTPELIHKMSQVFEQPTCEEGFYEVRVIRQG